MYKKIKDLILINYLYILKLLINYLYILKLLINLSLYKFFKIILRLISKVLLLNYKIIIFITYIYKSYPKLYS